MAASLRSRDSATRGLASFMPSGVRFRIPLRDQLSEHLLHPNAGQVQHHLLKPVVPKARPVGTVGESALVAAKIPKPLLEPIADAERVIGVTPTPAQPLEEIA